MFVHYRTHGLILKRENRGEADQLLTIFTKDFGKLEILAKAIRKIASKLRAGAGIFYLSEIEFIQGKTYKTLTDALAVNKFQNLRKDLKRLAISYKVSQLFDDLVRGQEKDNKIWQLFSEVFRRLDDLGFKISDLRLVYYYFFWNLLTILGYAPDFYHCVLCQKRLSSGQIYFSSGESGLICQSCLKSVKSIKEDKSSFPPFVAARPIKEIETSIIKILRIILKKDWSILSKLKIEKSHLEMLAVFSKNWQSFISNNW